MPMHQKIKAEWVTALRSGEYQQGREQLHSSGGHYCCLGVLCDLYARAHAVPLDTNLYADEGDTELPAIEIVKWAGLKVNDPVLVIDGSKLNASVHNDGSPDVRQRTFFEIADAIEAQL
jgi:hypothetical protein